MFRTPVLFAPVMAGTQHPFAEAFLDDDPSDSLFAHFLGLI
jgi:hypothetical protein